MNLPQPSDPKWKLLWKWLGSYTVTIANQPRPGDTVPELLTKILRQIKINAGVPVGDKNDPRPGDDESFLLQKILNVLNP